LPGSRIRSLNLRALDPNARGANANWLSPRTLRLLNPFVDHPNLLVALDTPPVEVAGSQHCYTVRQYIFTRDNPESDATRMTDYYACRPANNFHLKGIAPGSPR
jgi:hypothetical protein